MSNQIQGYQLSPQQQHLWLLQQDSSDYLAICAILIEGNLEVNILKSALEKVVYRNEILRTTFYRLRGVKIPIQVIENHSLFSFSETKLVNEYSLELEINKLFMQEKQRVFSWDKLPLLSTKLVTFSPEKYVLIVSLPALCADTLSLNNLAAEISRCYTACLQGEEILESPLQYADIAAWQNELLEAEATNTVRKYWQKMDFSRFDAYKLSTGNYQVKKAEFKPEFLSLPIHADIIKKIELIATHYQTTASVFLLTSWLILLSRLTGYSNLIVGTAFAGRNYEELKEALGLFAKYLPLTCDLEAIESFSDVLVKVEKITAEIAESQDFTWQTSITANQLDTEQPFFPFSFEFAEAPTKYVAGEISLSIYQHYVCYDRFQVKLASVRTVDETLKAEFYYDASLFTAADIQLLASQFESLLASCIKNPQTAISQLDILSPKERQQFLVEFNNTKTAEAPYQCIHHWFAEQCSRTPNNIAVVFGNQQLTYHQLNTDANRIAHYLQQLGVLPDILVGLCVERSPMMLIGLLGILKAGGAYVPIDPNYPQERQAYILKDTQMSLVLTQQSLATNLQRDNLKAICLDTDWDIIKTQPTENPVISTTALNLAYVIYTSGSTGEPKGTLIPHQGLVNYLNWCTQAYAVAKGSGTLVHSSLGFDLTITSLFAPLLVGNQVELLPESNNIENLSTTLKERSNLSLIKLTPSHLKLLSQQLSPQQAAGRTRAFIIGGENLTSENIAKWQDFAPDTILVNEYGPTETVVGCCIYQVQTHQPASIPIGQPIANTELYVLDSYLQPVPLGVTGELYIGGAGIARGYLNRPELTAEKFVPHPFSTEPGARLYKTGDLVRFRADGMLEFLGRIDEQVKIRGFRIELGEIESVLLQHPTIKDCVVTVQENAENDQRLIAYIVLKESSFSVTNLRNFLQSKLPEYMVPSVFITLKELPLTQNGKVNRQELPAPDKARLENDRLYVAPRNSTEDKIANIWTEILKLQRISIHDNFFDLGGHSLIVTQVISRLRDIFDVEIFVQQIFETPTIADLAVIVTQKLAEQTDEETLAQALAELELQDL
jgi:amino acid adenylation domain-containing protein